MDNVEAILSQLVDNSGKRRKEVDPYNLRITDLPTKALLDLIASITKELNTPRRLLQDFDVEKLKNWKEKRKIHQGLEKEIKKELLKRRGI